MFEVYILKIYIYMHIHIGLPGWLNAKESACQSRSRGRHGFNPWVGKILWRRKWQPTPVFLLEKFHGQRSLVGYSPWGHKESDTTEHVRAYTHTHTHTHTHTQTHTPPVGSVSLEDPNTPSLFQNNTLKININISLHAEQVWVGLFFA